MAVETVRIEGLKDLEDALSALPKATARNVLLRALKKAAQPIADHARRVVPVDSGMLRDSIKVSSRVRNRTGLAEYSETLRGGGTTAEARTALRAARRAGGAGESRAEVSVGPTAPHAHLVEFGTVKMVAEPFMRPAWEDEQDGALINIKSELSAEIDRAVARAARKAARLAKG